VGSKEQRSLVDGEYIADDTIRFERLLPGPIERVWAFLVEPEKRSRWLCAGRTDASEGGKVEMHFNNAELSNQPDLPPPEKYKDMCGEIRFEGRVLDYEPPTLLRHTWDFEGDYSEVTFELSSLKEQVKLVLTHKRLKTRDDLTGVGAGWHTHLDMLADVMNGREPEGFWRQHTANERIYEKLLEKS